MLPQQEMSSKAADVDSLLAKYPSLRVAYIDVRKVIRLQVFMITGCLA
jgi:hypothetical protein